MSYGTYSDIIRPAQQRQARLYDLSCVVVFSAFIALSAQLAIRLPFSPVPITGQTLAVLLTGVLLGSKKGAASVLLYIMEGAAGLPVFASSASGIIYLIGPTGGYIAGFLIAAYTAGYFAEMGWDRKNFKIFAALLVSSAIILICGVLWLSLFIGFEKAVQVGLIPFLIGDVIKIALTASLLPLGWKILKKS